MRTSSVIRPVLAAFVAGGLLASLLSAWAMRRDASAANTADMTKTQAVWHEAAWPFPMDEWGKGKAFRCEASACGTEVTVYLRAKIGFCNCTTGMTNDADLDRIGDFDLFGGALYAIGPSRPVKVAWMSGRSRAFAIRNAAQGDATMISIGLHDDCDALVATAVLARGTLAAMEPKVMAFLGGKTALAWARTTLGL